MQINCSHIQDAAKAGYDVVNSVRDNVLYGIVLFQGAKASEYHDGMRPWSASKSCWNKPVPGW